MFFLRISRLNTRCPFLRFELLESDKNIVLLINSFCSLLTYNFNNTFRPGSCNQKACPSYFITFQDSSDNERRQRKKEKKRKKRKRQKSRGDEEEEAESSEDPEDDRRKRLDAR